MIRFPLPSQRPERGHRFGLPAAYSDIHRQDLSRIRAHHRTLQAVTHRDAEPSALFAKAKDPKRLLSVTERQELLEQWNRFYLSFSELHEIAAAYRSKLDDRLAEQPEDQREVALEAYLLSWTARASALLEAVRMLRLTADSRSIAIMIDETSAGRKLETGTYSAFRQRLQEERDLADLIHFVKYEQPQILEQLAHRKGSIAARSPWLRRFWEESRDGVLEAALVANNSKQLRHTGLGITSRGVFNSAFSAVVTPVAKFFGSTRVGPLRRPMITKHQINTMLPHLEPGDVVLEKTNNYLSNLFITGFWGHAALYLGSFDEAAAYFDTPEVRAHYRSRGYDSFAHYISERHPSAVRAWRFQQRSGAVPRVLEGEGGQSPRVFFNTAHGTFSGDHVAILRPRLLSRLDKAQAIVDSLAYWRKKYDFDFDTRSDQAVVCTELVAKAYASGADKRGVDFDVDPGTAGRWIVYPNRVAELYAREAGHENRQLDLVYFLRGDEGELQANVATEEEFIASHTWRPLL